jgi:ppGpp synthetase/RelA/SpoT-type nucleotidyltranferase
MRILNDSSIADKLQSAIKSELDRLGLLCRVFSRAKSVHSLEIKINREPGKYSAAGKKIQDAFGVRIALYFPDDQAVAIQLLKNTFAYDESSSTIDTPAGSVFAANRCNLVFALPDDLADQSTLLSDYDCIDRTFEVQIRTVLSEGWHEVEHDMRYKCQADWLRYSDLDRALNGIYASLETSDWGMMKVFESLAYRHYKAHEWSQMIRTKFRLRSEGGLSPAVIHSLNLYPGDGKKIFRVNREEFLKKMMARRLTMPMTLDNIVFLINYSYIGSPALTELTPSPITDIFIEAGIPGFRPGAKAAV